MNGCSSLENHELLAIAAGIVIQAGRIANHYQRSVQNAVFAHSQGNYVTEGDIAVESFLKQQLGGLGLDTGFLAEESPAEGNTDRYWAIDPIDGTGNYLVGLPYSISLALIEEGNAIMSFVFDPLSDELWWAAKGEGAYRLSHASSHDSYGYDSLIDLSNPICLSDTAVDSGIVIFGMPYDRSKAHRILSYAEILFAHSDDLKRIGPASMDLCRVACGQAKLYLELDLHYWDYAAGELILLEAGGSAMHIGDLSLFGSDETVAWATKELGSLLPE